MDKFSKRTFILGLTLIVLGYFIPYDSLSFLLGDRLRPMGLICLVINPILGIMGSIFSLVKKQWIFLFLNLILIFSFFIVMGLGYYLVALGM